jgi:superoxide dismutase
LGSSHGRPKALETAKNNDLCKIQAPQNIQNHQSSSIIIYHHDHHHQSIKQASKQTNNKKNNQSVNQSINQSIKQTNKQTIIIVIMMLWQGNRWKTTHPIQQLAVP